RRWIGIVGGWIGRARAKGLGGVAEVGIPIDIAGRWRWDWRRQTTGGTRVTRAGEGLRIARSGLRVAGSHGWIGRAPWRIVGHRSWPPRLGTLAATDHQASQEKDAASE